MLIFWEDEKLKKIILNERRYLVWAVLVLHTGLMLLIIHSRENDFVLHFSLSVSAKQLYEMFTLSGSDPIAGAHFDAVAGLKFLSVETASDGGDIKRSPISEFRKVSGLMSKLADILAVVSRCPARCIVRRTRRTYLGAAKSTFPMVTKCSGLTLEFAPDFRRAGSLGKVLKARQ